MAIHRTQIYQLLWDSCEQLRGSMEATYYKDYVLSLLFIKYVSDKYTGRPNAPITIPVGGGFADMVTCVNHSNIGTQIDTIFSAFLIANGLADKIAIPKFQNAERFGKGSDMINRLSRLVSAFNTPSLDFGKNRADGDDLLGDAYEFLMCQFAFEAGKSKGQFYTPSEVSTVMAKLLAIQNISDPTIYDPTCGSGALLLKASNEARGTARLFGQEMDSATASLARMNMILHGDMDANIATGNTLADPAFIGNDGHLQQFDFVVANPPFSTSSWANGVNVADDPFGRFSLGTPPPKNGDYAFLLHIIGSMNPNGKGAVILPHGVLFRGNAEGAIREALVKSGVISAVIGLPANLFYGTSIPACLILLDKAGSADGIFIVDASKGFESERTQNYLRHSDMHRIVDAVSHRRDILKYARLVSYEEIRANDYNLNIPRYIDTSEPEDIQDVEAHLLGGIPNRDIEALSAYWDMMPTLKADLLRPIRKGYSALCVDVEQIRQAINNHPEFRAYITRVTQTFEAWQMDFCAYMDAYTNQHPDDFIREASEALLHVFDNNPLIDGYGVYQHLMTYWQSVMRDDLYLLRAGEWRGLNLDDNKPNTDLIPHELVIARFVSQQFANVQDLEGDLDTATQEISDLLGFHGGDDGLLANATDPKDKVTLVSIKARYRVAFGDAECADEVNVLEELIQLFERQATLRKQVKAGQDALVGMVERAYAGLGEADIKALIVNDKWLATLRADVLDEFAQVGVKLTARLMELGKRYGKTLGQLEQERKNAQERVNVHLRAMGYPVENTP